MPVYIDDAKNRFRGFIMCHMTAIPPDPDGVAELHRIAAEIGLKMKWFQQSGWPHYDVAQSKRSACISLGAIPATEQECAQLRINYKEALKQLKEQQQ